MSDEEIKLSDNLKEFNAGKLKDFIKKSTPKDLLSEAKSLDEDDKIILKVWTDYLIAKKEKRSKLTLELLKFCGYTVILGWVTTLTSIVIKSGDSWPSIVEAFSSYEFAPLLIFSLFLAIPPFNIIILIVYLLFGKESLLVLSNIILNNSYF